MNNPVSGNRRVPYNNGRSAEAPHRINPIKWRLASVVDHPSCVVDSRYTKNVFRYGDIARVEDDCDYYVSSEDVFSNEEGVTVDQRSVEIPKDQSISSEKSNPAYRTNLKRDGVCADDLAHYYGEEIYSNAYESLPPCNQPLVAGELKSIFDVIDQNREEVDFAKECLSSQLHNLGSNSNSIYNRFRNKSDWIAQRIISAFAADPEFISNDERGVIPPTKREIAAKIANLVAQELLWIDKIDKAHQAKKERTSSIAIYDEVELGDRMENYHAYRCLSQLRAKLGRVLIDLHKELQENASDFEYLEKPQLLKQALEDCLRTLNRFLNSENVGEKASVYDLENVEELRDLLSRKEVKRSKDENACRNLAEQLEVTDLVLFLMNLPLRFVESNRESLNAGGTPTKDLEEQMYRYAVSSLNERDDSVTRRANLSKNLALLEKHLKQEFDSNPLYREIFGEDLDKIRKRALFVLASNPILVSPLIAPEEEVSLMVSGVIQQLVFRWTEREFQYAPTTAKLAKRNLSQTEFGMLRKIDEPILIYAKRMVESWSLAGKEPFASEAEDSDLESAHGKERVKEDNAPQTQDVNKGHLAEFPKTFISFVHDSLELCHRASDALKLSVTIQKFAKFETSIENHKRLVELLNKISSSRKRIEDVIFEQLKSLESPDEQQENIVKQMLGGLLTDLITYENRLKAACYAIENQI